MATQIIPNLPSATALTGTEQFWAVQNGGDVRVAVSQVGTYFGSYNGANGLDGSIFFADTYRVATDSDDTNAVIRAVAAAQGAGGIVYLRPLGRAWIISSTVYVPSGVVIRGVKSSNFAGFDVTNSAWAAEATWVTPTGSTSCFNLIGNGSGIEGINFIHNQPTPGGSWTPTVYGYCVEVNGSITFVRDIVIVNASHGVWFNYTSASGGGKLVRFENCYIAAFNVCYRTTCVNDTMYINNIHCGIYWYADNSVVKAYYLANATGWYCGYTDDPMVNNIEFIDMLYGMYCVDETCGGVTHSLWHGQLSNINFNLPNTSIKVAASTTHVYADFTNTIAQQGHNFSITSSATMFDVGSDNCSLLFHGLHVYDAGGIVANVGAGTSGAFYAEGFRVEQYSTVASSQNCIVANTGADVQLANYRIIKSAGAGNRFGGTASGAVSTDKTEEIRIYSSSASTDVNTANTSYNDFSLDIWTILNVKRFHQIRLIGQVYIYTGVATSTLSMKLTNVSSLSPVTVSSATSSTYQSIDSGWVDISETDLASNSNIGRVQIATTISGVRAQSAALSILLK